MKTERMEPVRMAQSKGRLDLVLVGAMVSLVLVGLLMIYSASTLYSERLYGSAFYLVKNQLLHLLVGSAALLVALKVPYTFWKKYAPMGLLVCLVLLVVVLIPGVGHSAGGARRWLRMAGFSFQPVEILKVMLVAYVASSLSRKAALMGDFKRGVAPNLLVMGFFLGLLLLQPDFGSVVLITFTLLLMIFVGGAHPGHMAGAVGAMGLVGVYLVASKSYRMARITAFLDPWQDRLDTGFQIIQSFLAFGNGGLLGAGIGASRQKMFFLPDAHTDFIFSILAEETGFVGVVAVMGLLALFLRRAFAIARNTPDEFGRYLAFGLASCLTLQVIINLAVVMGMMPTKGLPLPFVSYGGSSLVVCMFMAGIILNVGKNGGGSPSSGRGGSASRQAEPRP